MHPSPLSNFFARFSESATLHHSPLARRWLLCKFPMPCLFFPLLISPAPRGFFRNMSIRPCRVLCIHTMRAWAMWRILPTPSSTPPYVEVFKPRFVCLNPSTGGCGPGCLWPPIFPRRHVLLLLCSRALLLCLHCFVHHLLLLFWSSFAFVCLFSLLSLRSWFNF